MPASDTIEAQGHLIDSGLLSAIFDKIIEHKAAYEILKFDIGRTNDDPSRIEMRITAADGAVLDDLLQQLTTFGCHPVRERDALVKPAEKDRCVPDDFYSTTNHRTHVRLGGRWVEVEQAAHGRGHRRRRRAAPSAASCATSRPASRSSAATTASA